MDDNISRIHHCGHFNLDDRHRPDVQSHLGKAGHTGGFVPWAERHLHALYFEACDRRAVALDIAVN